MIWNRKSEPMVNNRIMFTGNTINANKQNKSRRKIITSRRQITQYNLYLEGIINGSH